MRTPLLTLALALAACQSTTPPPEPVVDAGLTYVELLGAQDPPEIDAETLAEVRAGHFSNMAVMARERDLLLAGPVGEPLPVEGQQGIYIFDEADVERALESAHTDPAYLAGLMEVRAHALRGEAALRALPELEAEAIESGAASGRLYTLALVDEDVCLPGLREEGRILFEGVLGGEHAGTRLLLLDYAQLPSAIHALASRVEPERRTLSPLWTSVDLERVPAEGAERGYAYGRTRTSSTEE